MQCNRIFNRRKTSNNLIARILEVSHSQACQEDERGPGQLTLVGQ